MDVMALRLRDLGLTTLVCAALLAALAPRLVLAQDYAAIVAAGDRSDADRQTDKRRDPVKLLSFVGVKTGMKMLDMGAGGGYSTELMARAVGPSGVVYAQDQQPVNERANQAFEARAKTPAMKNVVRVLRSYSDPVPPEARNLDLITFFFAYHDVTYMPVDRAEMNRKLFAALKPGGMLVIADHSAKPEDGTKVGKTFHRVAEASVRQELEAAGFKLVDTGNFLRHPEDTRDFIIFRSKIPIDEFVLKFQRVQ
jgi:predicted methyltransferase